jgi:hypothetical protein
MDKRRKRGMERRKRKTRKGEQKRKNKKRRKIKNIGRGNFDLLQSKSNW